jgi:hypothetical protein
MRRSWFRSSFLSDFSSLASNLVVQAKALPHFSRIYNFSASGSNIFYGLIGKVDILKIVQVLPDSLTSVIGFRPAG